MQYCDGVFEGGGVKGIALAGAACGFMQHGYTFRRVAGSSAGAIVATLIAAGLGCDELEAEMRRVEYHRLKGKDFLDHFGFFGKLISLSRSLGIYNLDYLEQWLYDVLLARGIRTFGDLKKVKATGKRPIELKITATDLTDNALLVFPDDLNRLGIDPDNFSIARAVRISASIPLYFEPEKIRDSSGKVHYLVDGGVLSNYPVWIFDDGVSCLPLPVFGFRFYESAGSQRKKELGKLKLPEYVGAVISTLTEAHDMMYAYSSRGDAERTVEIDTRVYTDGNPEKIDTTDFDLNETQAAALYQNGIKAAERFLSSWDFAAWQREFR